MSETKAVAVLLWLFELGRKGPKISGQMNGLWWGGAIFLCLLLLSVTHIAIELLVRFAGIATEPFGIPASAFLMITVAIVVAWLAAPCSRYFKLWRTLLIAIGAVAAILGEVWALHSTLTDHAVPPIYYGIAAGAVFVGGALAAAGCHKGLGLLLLLLGAIPLLAWLLASKLQTGPLPVANNLTDFFLVSVIAFAAAATLMGKHGAWAFGLAYVFSWLFFGLYELLAYFKLVGTDSFWGLVAHGRVPWGLNSPWSTVAALIIIGIYLIINAAFLQPYLGDAARYFRNSPANVAVRRAIRKEAVDTLDQLHRSRLYDRIMVVAHSLGTVVAYDMLRAYYSRICRQIPVDYARLNPEFEAIDQGGLHRDGMRKQGRELIRKLAANSQLSPPQARGDDFILGRSRRQAGGCLAGDRFRHARQPTYPRALYDDEPGGGTPARRRCSTCTYASANYRAVRPPGSTTTAGCPSPIPTARSACTTAACSA